MNASAMRVEETVVVEVRPGDAVTPTAGVFRGMRFVVMETRPSMLGIGLEVKIRMKAPLVGGPAPLWVPVEDVAPLYDATRCQVCGSDRHPRCNA